VDALAEATADLPQVASEGAAQEGATQDPVPIMSRKTVDDLPSREDADKQLGVAGTPRGEPDSPQQSALSSSELPQQSAPSEHSAPSPRSQTTADSATNMLYTCKTVGCGKPTWNGVPSGYCYERGPYGKSSLS